MFNSQRKVNDEFGFYSDLNLNKFVYLDEKDAGRMDSDCKVVSPDGDFDGDTAMVDEDDVDAKVPESYSSENDELFPQTDVDGDVNVEGAEELFTPRRKRKRKYSDVDGGEDDVVGLDADLDTDESDPRPNDIYSHYLPNGPYQYQLHSVLVHSGSTYGGHYKAFIRPDGDSDWYSFNDEYTSSVKDSDAITGNFGGTFQRQSAYMLVYVQKSKLKDLCGEMKVEEIPAELKEQIDRTIEVGCFVFHQIFVLLKNVMW